MRGGNVAITGYTIVYGFVYALTREPWMRCKLAVEMLASLETFELTNSCPQPRKSNERPNPPGFDRIAAAQRCHR